MKFRRLFCFAISLEISLAGIAAHGSYVVEAEGIGLDSGRIATGADFDFVTHDFGMEPKDAIQITVDNLSSATNLRGNLLLRSFEVVDGSSPEGAAHDELLSARHSVTTGTVAIDSSTDYSHYDDDVADADQNSNGLSSNLVNDNNYTLFALTGEPVPEGIRNFPSIDSNAIFWILRSGEFTSFSQLTAARFGFHRSQ